VDDERKRPTCTEDFHFLLHSIAFDLHLRKLNFVSQTHGIGRTILPLVCDMLHRVRVCIHSAPSATTQSWTEWYDFKHSISLHQLIEKWQFRFYHNCALKQYEAEWWMRSNIESIWVGKSSLQTLLRVWERQDQPVSSVRRLTERTNVSPGKITELFNNAVNCGYLQLSISSEQTWVSIGNNFRFMRHIAVTVNLSYKLHPLSVRTGYNVQQKSNLIIFMPFS